jgi:hypothetical protein
VSRAREESRSKTEDWSALRHPFSLFPSSLLIRRKASPDRRGAFRSPRSENSRLKTEELRAFTTPASILLLPFSFLDRRNRAARPVTSVTFCKTDWVDRDLSLLPAGHSPEPARGERVEPPSNGRRPEPYVAEGRSEFATTRHEKAHEFPGGTTRDHKEHRVDSLRSMGSFVAKTSDMVPVKQRRVVRALSLMWPLNPVGGRQLTGSGNPSAVAHPTGSGLWRTGNPSTVAVGYGGQETHPLSPLAMADRKPKTQNSEP